jgi:hypothetical protein
MLRKHKYLSKENHLCQKEDHPPTGFPVGTASVFERNTSCSLGFSWWREALFDPDRPIHLS